MKVTKVDSGLILGNKHWFIYLDNKAVHLQRAEVRCAGDDPLSETEKLIIAFCETFVGTQQ